MKRILTLAAGGIGLLLIAALILPFFIPTSVYKAQIEQAASTALGVDVRIEGDPRLSLLPSISARVDGVQIANPEGFSAPHLLQAGSLRADLQLWPLLSRQIVIEEITLSDLDLQIESRADGAFNLMVVAETAAGEPTDPNADESPEDAGAGFLTTVDRAALRNASIRVFGPTVETPLLLTDFQGEARFKGLDQPLSSKGEGVLNGQTFAYAVKLDTLEALLNDAQSQLDAELETDFLAVGFDGAVTASLETPENTALAGQFSLNSDQLGVITSFIGDELPPIVKLSKSVEARGTVNGSLSDTLNLAFERARFEASYGTVSYTGGLAYASTGTITLAGDYDTRIADPTELLNAIDLGLPIRAAALQDVKIIGSVNGPLETLQLQFQEATLKAEGLETSYSGGLDLADMANPNLSGKFTFSGRQLQKLLQDPGPLAAQLDVLGTLDFAGDLKGPATELTVSNAKLTQRSDWLSTDFQGQLSLLANAAQSSKLTVRSDSPRGLLARLGSPLPDGETLQNFSLEGQLSGSGQAPKLNAVTLILDEMTATGSLAANLAGARPNVTATLVTDILNLTPFMSSDESAPQTPANLATDWSDESFDLAALNLLDAQLNITASEILMDKITLSDARLTADLQQGRLNAAFTRDEQTPGFRAFEGDWSGSLVLDTARATPQMRLQASADSIAAKKLLGDLTGYTGLSGLGDVTLDLTSQGSSLKALVNGLDGSFNSDLNQGALSGINLAKLVRDASSLSSLLSSGNLNLQSFRDAISPEAETDFSRFIGNLQFNQGVATITDLQLNNPVVAVIGSGRIDLGARSIDIRLAPSVDVNAQGQGQSLGLNSIPIPVRISGPWTKLSFGLDTAAVQAELTRQARARAGQEIGNRLGGDVGTIIGGIVGGEITQPTETSTPEDAGTPRQSLEDELRDRAVEGALGALFGRPSASEEEDDNR